MSTELSQWTVIVPCHNAVKTLRRCIEAVQTQSRRPGEVVVVDDASDDGTAEIAEALGCKVIRVEPNRGPAAARNRGAAEAAGEVLFFLDADIELRPDALARAAAVLEGDPRIGLVQGVYAAEPMIDDGPVERYKTLFEHHWRTRSAGRGGATLFALTAIRTEVFKATGGFDEALRSGEDVDLGSRLPEDAVVVTDPGVVGRHDDVDRLGALLEEQWRRSLRFAELVFRARKAGPGRSSEHRPAVSTGAFGPAAVLAAAAIPASVPLVLWSPWLALAPVAFAIGFGAACAPLLRIAARRGIGWAAAVYGLHLLYVGTSGLASAVGVFRPLRGRS
ncbi:glycosyltransferase family 2 protein [Glycomyces sp. TRM65418]|uniref:glycosyltransferase family 2 protein n=1 Tax=Glycomyces sp. TRM65418 TaxID=2867006 RepID=UPI001CE4DB2D|nr:glycosyltransferase family 2 protein [Glycomyces sp. TRM65418]MCC3765902.1 glycosyltransferase family 2 protein [Glycomyces sp. TRM65418]QZD55485.1 glycosyltransferase family 2 protein [Glycomyces sp. TRM65418]